MRSSAPSCSKDVAWACVGGAANGDSAEREHGAERGPKTILGKRRDACGSGSGSGSSSSKLKDGLSVHTGKLHRLPDNVDLEAGIPVYCEDDTGKRTEATLRVDSLHGLRVLLSVCSATRC